MLTNIELFQFKRFKDEYLNLAPLTLLTGINGTGKSSIIQALLVLRQSFDRGDLQNHKRIVIEDKELVNLISPDDMLCSKAESTKVSISITENTGEKATWEMIAEGSSNTLPVKFISDNEDIYLSALFSNSFQFLNAERVGPRVSYNRLSVSRPHSPIGYRGEFAASRILEALNKNEKVELEHISIKGIEPNVYEQLSDWISEIIYPGTIVSDDDSDATKITMQYTFKEEQTKTFNPMNIGFGFSYALPVILAVLTAKIGSILIVENPEAHLHPKGQAQMGKLLALAAQSGVQVLIESHSDHLLNGIRLIVKGDSTFGKLDSDKVLIHFFSPEYSPESIAFRTLQIDSNGKLNGWPNGFFDEWESNLRKLLNKDARIY
jgi:predicted ATPase